MAWRKGEQNPMTTLDQGDRACWGGGGGMAAPHPNLSCMHCHVKTTTAFPHLTKPSYSLESAPSAGFRFFFARDNYQITYSLSYFGINWLIKILPKLKGHPLRLKMFKESVRWDISSETEQVACVQKVQNRWSNGLTCCKTACFVL